MRAYRATCAPSAAPLMQRLPQPTARFPHRRIQDPRGFHLGRFSNAGRACASAQRSAATRIRKPSPLRTLADAWGCCAAARQTRLSLCQHKLEMIELTLCGQSAISLRLRLRQCRLWKPHFTAGQFRLVTGIIECLSTHLILSSFGRFHNRYRLRYPQELSFVSDVWAVSL